MGINVLEMVQGALVNQIVGQIGGLLGENEANTGNAVTAALPSILGGLMKQASTPSGAQDIFANTQNADGDILSNIVGAISGGNHSALIQTGMGLVGSIFGAKQSGLIGSIARMAGIGQGSAGSLLGLLAPIVMGALRKVMTSDNLDAGGLANLLADQKDHVASALPKELSTELDLGDFLGQGTDAVRGAANAAGNAAQGAAHAAADTARSGGSLLGKLIPFILIGLLVWLIWSFLGGTKDDGDSRTNIERDASGTMVDVDRIQGGLSSALGDMTTAISGISDETSATVAVGKLKESTSLLGGLGLNNLPAPAKSAVTATLGPLLQSLTGALAKAYAIPGVQGIVEPIVGPIVKELSAFAN